ncbi:ribonuclease H-like domain-containing protein [Tanacetum coccineum]
MLIFMNMKIMNGGFVPLENGKGRISKNVKSKQEHWIFDNGVLNVLSLSSDFKLLDEKSSFAESYQERITFTVLDPKEWLYPLKAKEFKILSPGPSSGIRETSWILKTFITEVENQLDHKVKVIKSDNGTEFKNSNGVAERKNRTLIEAARTMLVDSRLPTTFWFEAGNTACYVLNRVLVIKPNSKTPYELIRGRTPLINFMKPFGCPVTILNTKDHLGKLDGKADEGFFVGYSVVSKAMRVFNKRTRIVEETLNIRFLENAPNVTGNGPDWLFDVNSLSKSINYVPVVVGNQTNGIAGTRDNIFAEVDEIEASDKDRKDEQDSRSEFERLLQQEKKTEHPNSTNSINTVSTPVSTTEPSSTNDAPSSPVNAAKTSEEHLFE